MYHLQTHQHQPYSTLQQLPMPEHPWTSLNWPPITEFAYNNAESLATRTTPFFANKGYHLELPTYPDHLSTSHAAAHQFVTNLADIHTRLRENLSIMQQHTQLSVDSTWMPMPILNIGDKVFLCTEFIHMTCPSWKLVDKYLGPFEIIGIMALPDLHPLSFNFLMVCAMCIQCGTFHSWNLPMTPILKDTHNHPCCR